MDNYIQILTVIISLSALIMAIYNLFFQIKSFQKQLKLNFFSDYTKRYQYIISNLPSNIDKETFDYQKLSEDKKDEVLRYMRVYFDLCSEEYFLYKRDYIDSHVWEIWKEGITDNFKYNSFREAWIFINDNSSFYDGKFKEWIDSIISDNK